MSQPQLQKSNPDSQIHTCPMHPEVQQDGPGQCPKCGMHLVPEVEAKASHRHHHHGTGHGKAASVESGSVSGEYDKVPADWIGTVYTCPMHAEVRQTEPGSCPICGMGLELESAAMAEAGPNPELVDFTRRF